MRSETAKVLIASLSSAFCFTLALIGNVVRADNALSPFRATCKDTETHAYRLDTDVNGAIIGDGFEEGEKFLGGAWTFVYEGGNYVIVDGDTAAAVIAVAADGDVVVALTKGSNPLAAGGWLYAIHLKLNKIVASQVNAHSSPWGDGVKARSVNLTCDFE